MTITEASKGIVVKGHGKRGAHNYDIEFINNENPDEIQLTAHTPKELAMLYTRFCKRNGHKTDTVTHIERIN